MLLVWSSHRGTLATVLLGLERPLNRKPQPRSITVLGELTVNDNDLGCFGLGHRRRKSSGGFSKLIRGSETQSVTIQKLVEPRCEMVILDRVLLVNERAASWEGLLLVSPASARRPSGT
jgi:hypothetical protein